MNFYISKLSDIKKSSKLKLNLITSNSQLNNKNIKTES